jgi:hypothetical protein
MYKQIIETFPPTSSATLYEIKEDINDNILMTNSQRLTEMFLEKDMPIDLITKLIKNYILTYKEVKKIDKRMVTFYTAEVYIEHLKEKYVH